MHLIFEWDHHKAHANARKHGVAFEEAKTVFGDPLLLTWSDELHSEAESRYISIGYSARKHLLLIVHTEQTQGSEIRIRIISSRKATRQEQQSYEEPNR